MVKGFALDDDRFLNGLSKNNWFIVTSWIHWNYENFEKSIDFVNKISYNEYTIKDTFKVSLSNSNVNRHPVGEI